MWFGLEKTLFIPMKSYGESSWPPPFTHHSEHSPSAWRSENQPIEEEEEKCWQNNKRRAQCDENSNTQEAACTWNVCFVCGAWAKKKHEQWNVCFGNTRRSMNLYLQDVIPAHLWPSQMLHHQTAKAQPSYLDWKHSNHDEEREQQQPSNISHPFLRRQLSGSGLNDKQ